jgi:hypothetical protein
MEFSELWFGQVLKLCQNSVNSDREPTLDSHWCIGILACRDTHNITLEWVTLPVIVSNSFACLMLFEHLHTV